MDTDSYISLYTYLFSWDFYNKIFFFLQETRLWALPFFYIFWKNTFGLVGDKQNSIYEISLKRMEIDCYVAIVVILLAFVPLVNLASNEIEFTNRAGETVTPDSNNTTFLDAFSERPSSVRVPVIWYGVGKFSGAVNALMKAILPDVSEARLLSQQLQTIQVTDQTVQAELETFYSQCYVPSLSIYSRINPFEDSVSNELPLLRADARRAADTWGKDVDWVGSRVFTETSGLYKFCLNPNECGVATTPRRPVPGWDYDWNDPSGVDYGKPYCDEWWLDEGQGLREKLLQEATNSGQENGILARNLPTFLSGVSEEEAGDRLIKRMLFNVGTPLKNQEIDQSDGFLGSIAGFIGGAGALVGTGILTIIMSVVIQMLPIAQALILFSVTTLLPLALVFSAYDIKAVIFIAIFFFTVSFWTSLWAIAAWLDDKALQALYPDSGFIEFSGSGFTNDLLLGLATLLIYGILPTIWTYLLILAGSGAAQRSGDALDSFRSSTSDSANSGLSSIIR